MGLNPHVTTITTCLLDRGRPSGVAYSWSDGGQRGECSDGQRLELTTRPRLCIRSNASQGFWRKRSRQISARLRPRVPHARARRLQHALAYPAGVDGSTVAPNASPVLTVMVICISRPLAPPPRPCNPLAIVTNAKPAACKIRFRRLLPPIQFCNMCLFKVISHL